MKTTSFSHRASRIALLLALGALTSFGLSQNAHAEPISITNFSFEAPAIADTTTSSSIPGWTVATANNQFSSAVTFNPNGRYNGDAGQGTPSGGDGAQSVFIQGTNSIQSASSLATVQAGDTFTLTVAIGNPFGQSIGALRYGFLVGDGFVTGSFTDVPSATAEISFPNGTFSDRNFTYTASAMDAGKTLKIFFGQNGEGSFPEAGFDNVRLDGPAVMATPEPSTWAMMFLGMGAMVLVMRRKRDAVV